MTRTDLLEAIREWADAPIPREGWEVHSTALTRRVDLIANREEAGTLVVALVGGSGAGKSSLLNALAGAEWAEVAATRPTTRNATIYCGRDAVPSSSLLTALGNPPVRRSDEPLDLALLDLPDVDSIEPANREYTRRAIEHAHIVLLVTTPESQAAERFREFVRERAGDYRWAVVSNKKDLHPDARDDLLRDLRDALAEAEISPDRVFETSLPPGRPAEGVEDVRAWIRETARESPRIRTALGLDQLERLRDEGDRAGEFLDEARSDRVIEAAEGSAPALVDALRSAVERLETRATLRAMVETRIPWSYPRPFGILWELMDLLRSLPHRVALLPVWREERAAAVLTTGLSEPESDRHVSGKLDALHVRVREAAHRSHWTEAARSGLALPDWRTLQQSTAAALERGIDSLASRRPSRALWFRYNLLPAGLLVAWLVHVVVAHVVYDFHRFFEGVPANEILFVMLVLFPISILLQSRLAPSRRSFAERHIRELLDHSAGHAVDDLVDRARHAALDQDAPLRIALSRWRELRTHMFIACDEGPR